MPILGITASSYFAVTGDFQSIATVTVGSGGSSSVEFTSIPSTYTHLQIRGIARSSAAVGEAQVYSRYNDDTGNNYAGHYLYGSGSSAAAGSATSQSSGYTLRMPGASASASIFGGFVIDILDYANTNKYKTIRSLSGQDQNGSGNIWVYSHLWQNTNAITKIVIGNFGGNDFAQYSHFALYGIKSA